MIPTATQVWLVIEPLDMRTGIDGLSLRIQNTLGRSPCDGTAYAFRNRRRNRLKLLIWDGTGVWLCQRRLHKGQHQSLPPLNRHNPGVGIILWKTPSDRLPWVEKIGYSPDRSAPGNGRRRFKHCSVRQNSMAWTPPRGYARRWKNCPPA